MLTSEIVTSYIGGMSVIEIARVLVYAPGRVHDVLRSARAIEPVTRQYKPPPLIFTNYVLYDALKKRNYSVERWAQGWGFEIEDVLPVLADPTSGVTTGHSSEVIKAIGRDLPKAYESVFKEQPQYLKLRRQVEPAYEYKIVWDDVERHFIATIVSDVTLPASFATIRGVAPARPRAVEILEHHEKICRQVSKLRDAVAIIQSWNSDKT